ncbi:hypothetical protein [Reichenbachiella sp. MALMAid0571]|uniref:hypothetical protein n=1 Tax=Reichenbachiella sp. MALMAid0571 TaxID=3143939 RepID=UPI0032E00CD3
MKQSSNGRVSRIYGFTEVLLCHICPSTPMFATSADWQVSTNILKRSLQSRDDKVAIELSLTVICSGAFLSTPMFVSPQTFSIMTPVCGNLPTGSDSHKNGGGFYNMTKQRLS